MPWSKLKNIILMILLVTNLCLLVLVGGQELQNSRLKSRAREDTIQLNVCYANLGGAIRSALDRIGS